jgi:dTDP-4-dehydrorhamnose 3,5-epimerase
VKFTKTPIPNLLVIEPKVFQDDRGYFMESFKKSLIEQYLPEVHFIQDNESKSTCGVLRGIHFQKPPFAQTKLVRVIEGEVLDVAVDLRTKSPTYGKHFSILLSGDNKKQFLIPKGFGHGFVVLSESAIFAYKVDNEYHPEYDSGIRFDDKDLGIDWNLNHSDIVLSKKDLELQNFKNFISPF